MRQVKFKTNVIAETLDMNFLEQDDRKARESIFIACCQLRDPSLNCFPVNKIAVTKKERCFPKRVPAKGFLASRHCRDSFLPRNQQLTSGRQGRNCSN